MPELEAVVHGIPHAAEVFDEELKFRSVLEPADEKLGRRRGDGNVEAARDSQSSENGQEEAFAHGLHSTRERPSMTLAHFFLRTIRQTVCAVGDAAVAVHLQQ